MDCVKEFIAVSVILVMSPNLHEVTYCCVSRDGIEVVRVG